MKGRLARRCTLAALAALVVALSAAPVTAEAVVRTWDGGGAPNDVTWSNPVNWVGDVAPGTGDAIVFPPSATVRGSTNDLPAVFSSLTISSGVLIFAPVRVAGPVTIGPQTLSGGAATSFIENLALEADLTVTAMSEVRIQALRLGGRALRLAGNGTVDAFIKVAATPGSVEVAMQDPGTAVLAVNLADQDPGTPPAAAAVPARITGGTAKIGSWSGDIVMDGGALDTGGMLTGRLTVNAGDVRPLSGALGDVVLTPGARWLLYNGGVEVRTIDLGGATFVPAGFSSVRFEDPVAIIPVAGPAAPVGTFNGLPDRGRFTNNVGAPYEIGYHGGDGNDITLTKVGSLAHRSGYWMIDAGGTVYPFGDAEPPSYTAPLTARAIGITHAPGYNGVWAVAENGDVHGTCCQAPRYSTPPPLRAGERVTSLSYPRARFGYWLFSSLGRVFAFGEAAPLGGLDGVALNGPVLGSVGTPTGNGYYMVASDGGIFAFGDAAFRGSMGGRRLNATVVGLAPDPDGHGYWLVASDGGIFAFDAPFRGSMGGRPLNQPVIGMVAYGDGYILVASDGGIFNFSNKPFAGSLGANPPTQPIVAVTPLDD